MLKPLIPVLRHLSTAAAPWLRRYKLGRGFWLFFTAALFWDAGFGVYFFLFNLYLLDFHLNERTIGLVSGALSLGLIAGMLPAVILTRRIGARRLLICGFLAASVLGVPASFSPLGLERLRAASLPRAIFPGGSASLARK